jgi:hypothetical protein
LQRSAAPHRLRLNASAVPPSTAQHAQCRKVPRSAAQYCTVQDGGAALQTGFKKCGRAQVIEGARKALREARRRVCAVGRSQRAALRCNAPCCLATCCIASCCAALQRAVAQSLQRVGSLSRCCNVPHYVAHCRAVATCRATLQRVAPRCNLLHYAATCRTTLQRVAPRCNASRLRRVGSASLCWQRGALRCRVCNKTGGAPVQCMGQNCYAAGAAPARVPPYRKPPRSRGQPRHCATGKVSREVPLSTRE